MICEMTTAVTGLLRMASLVLCFAEIFCVIARALQRRGIRHMIPSFILLLCGYIFFQVQESIDRADPEASLSAWSRPGNIGMFFVLLVLAGLTIGEIFTVFRWRKDHWSSNTVRESINQLPTGLCFSAPNGSVLLANHVMEKICLAVTGEALLDANVFWEAVEKNGILTLENGSAWNLDRRILSTEMGDVYQITASDITRKHALMQELRQEQKRLKKINERLCAYSGLVTELTREKEILAARIRVHDNLGECLLAAKRCILTPVGRKEKEEVLRMWKQNITLLEVPADDEKNNSLDELLAAAEAVGVRVVFDGKIPPEGSCAREITEAAVHECVTNTVRHAHGSKLFVEMRRNGTQWTIRCTNNGEAPEGEIREGGGLTSLRCQVEREGGVMTVESAPRFALILCVEEGGLS